MMDKKMKSKMGGDARREVLEALREMAMEKMSEGLKDGLKKVSVMAPDQEGLEEGLSKAKELVEGMPMGSEEAPSPESEEMEEEMSPEEIDAEIERLQQLKMSMQK